MLQSIIKHIIKYNIHTAVCLHQLLLLPLTLVGKTKTVLESNNSTKRERKLLDTTYSNQEAIYRPQQHPESKSGNNKV